MNLHLQTNRQNNCIFLKTIFTLNQWHMLIEQNDILLPLKNLKLFNVSLFHIISTKKMKSLYPLKTAYQKPQRNGEQN